MVEDKLIPDSQASLPIPFKIETKTLHNDELYRLNIFHAFNSWVKRTSYHQHCFTFKSQNDYYFTILISNQITFNAPWLNLVIRVSYS